MTHLLDANTLLAMTLPNHAHHAAIHHWFSTEGSNGWATCALTQSALVRLSLQPTIVGRSVTAREMGVLLARMTAHKAHRFLDLPFGFAEVLETCTGGLWGHRQITDAWLLTTATYHGCKLLTFDRGIAALLKTDRERANAVTLLTGD
jgi:uncharacterized protein